MGSNEQEIRELNLLGAKVMGWHTYTDLSTARGIPEGAYPRAFVSEEASFVINEKGKPPVNWNPATSIDDAWLVFMKVLDMIRDGKVPWDQAVQTRGVMDCIFLSRQPKDAALALMRSAAFALKDKTEVEKDGA